MRGVRRVRHRLIPLRSGAAVAALVAASCIGLPSRLATAAAPVSSARSSAALPQIWFAPLDTIRDGRPYVGSADYMQMFQPGAPWAGAYSHIQVFKLYPQFVASASEDQLRLVIEWLKQHNIGLAVEAGLLSPSAKCGRGVEGYQNNQLAMAQRIRRLGGVLQYVLADEPLWFGHGFAGRAACRSGISALAKEAANSARKFQSVFPQVQFIDGVPLSNFKNNAWIDEVGQFLEAFRASYGQPFSAVAFDIGWWVPGWQARAKALTTYLRGHGMRIGVIYDGNPNARSDREWLNQARDHYREYESLIGSPPDVAIFQSWHRYPTRLLPDTDAEAFTSIILDYVKFEQSRGSAR